VGASAFRKTRLSRFLHPALFRRGMDRLSSIVRAKGPAPDGCHLAADWPAERAEKSCHSAGLPFDSCRPRP
jgi:hypothetical protein